jgi:NodT family efflux transporter outer membrane factor (OMF) lipoprotein
MPHVARPGRRTAADSSVAAKAVRPKIAGWAAFRSAGGGACVSLLMLSGCAVGPDFKMPDAPNVAGFLPTTLKQGDSAQRFDEGADVSGQWWNTFHSHALNALVERAVAQNADLQAAQAALRAARENGVAARGIFYPQVSANFNPTGGKTATDVSSPLASNPAYYTLTTAQLSISYTPDVFGLNRRTAESADALTLAQRYQVEAVYLTLTSNVVAAAIQEASLRAQIEATKKIIGIESDLLVVLRRQLGAGQVASADVLAQEAALAQAQQTLAPLEKQLGITRDQLTALAGQYSSDEITEKFDLKSLHLPHELPVSLPSTLVTHRPDVRAAEANLRSASALIGVAVANRLPVISLTADLGSSPTDLGRLFTPPSLFYALAGNVAQTVLDGGTLYHKQKQAEAEYDQAYAQYRSTVIVAFQNVADALRALKIDSEAVRAAIAAEKAAQKSLLIVTQQVKVGQVSSTALLNAQQVYFQALMVRVQSEASRFADTAALFQALGGGWWNRSDVASETE